MTPEAGPLAGLRVVALEQAVAAPLCSRHLADLGADVVKIERPGRGDFARDYDTFVKGMASHFVWLNYGKRSVVLDLKAAEGKDKLLHLLEDADVFLSNLTPGAVERIVSSDELERLNPRLVTCQISGYGPSGPYRDRKAFDLLVQGEAGVTANTGSPGAAAKPGVSLADLGAGVYAATSILAALRARDISGRGEHVHVAMFDVLAEWMSPLLLAHREGGVDIAPAGTRHATITPYGPYVTADGVTLNIAVQNDRQWLLLCEVLELRTLAEDDRLAANSGRLARRSDVERAVADAVIEWPSFTLEQALDQVGVPWGRMNGTPDVANHPQLEAGERWRPVSLPGGETVSVLESPFRVGRYRDQVTPRVPGLGEHTEEALHDWSATRSGVNG
ncbi:CaiB/BaiF CoA transferase family protein [Gordonia humi]|uniref:Crotonobetainyl-CoA:carnitine CoA-transferase CaiB-like acyl-CoA transferase n=2 Tax=Gordonia humi TaxID=686429 RepID=A0A840F2P5_9ACTN|nr:CaiB/BaiF CoA-transferase family protein [Gordonia humi]MBB4138171.1 crotonobetainyl-CoA:carnitine CoA-transferase CaiB-like acyl-CoA transferase [Gordonia humi]